MTQNSQIHKNAVREGGSQALPNPAVPGAAPEIKVALLTGGSDRPYVWGLTTELMSKGVGLDLIGSDELAFPEFRNRPKLNFLNLRGDQRSDVGAIQKIIRISAYYAKLIRYAAAAKPRIFHILWNNKFETFDRTFLMLYYKLLGKRIVLTAHNVNAGRRDSEDTPLNRLTLRIQYRLADHIFVHTEKMKLELIEAFGAHEARISVIPFGINNSVPNTDLTPSEAKRILGIADGKRTILFFGRITPYKGVEYLIDAFRRVLPRGDDYRLIIAGRLDAAAGEKYWNTIQETIREDVRRGRVLLKTEFIPDEQTEVYFKAADVLVLPYRHIYQSGVLFLGHSFGLPVLAADVGSLKEDIVEGKTGFMFKPEDPIDLASVMERYFASDLFADLESRRQQIREFSMERHSWDSVGQATVSVYAGLVQDKVDGGLADCDAPRVSLRQSD
jgi:D-inositol-3-phosphate glycosyltransferase